ncbi:MAG: DinB family protein [Anaerolineales bacterium]|nr:DinB family protein [Anaerolineales bacterium]
MNTLTEAAGRLTEAVEAFVAYMESLPPAQLGKSPDERWWPREVLSHLVFWHEHYVQIAGAIVQGREPDLYRETFIVLNARAARQEQDTPIPELLRRFRDAQEKLATIAADERAPGLHWSFRQGSKSRRFDEDLDMIARHILGHVRQLRRRGFGRLSRRA